MIRIAHVGGWSRNYGDLALQDGQMRVLSEDAPEPLEFLPIHCQQTWFHPDLIERINDTCDLMLLGGGGMIFHRPEDSSKSGWQFNIALEDLQRIRIPLATYAIGYNAFHFDALKLVSGAMDHLKATQAKAALFSVRNEGSKAALVRGGLDGDRIDVIPDPGMYIKPHAFTLPEQKNGAIKIGLNWAGDRPHFRFAEPWEANRTALIQSLCEAFLKFERENGPVQIYFIPHLVDRIDSDVWPEFKKHLGERAINLEDAAPHIYPPSFAQSAFLADTYRQMDMVIGMRGHANIVPFGQGVPTIGLGSHDKVGFFLKEVGLDSYWLSTQDQPDAGGPTAIADLLNRVYTNREPIRAGISKAHSKCRETTRLFHQRLFESL